MSNLNSNLVSEINQNLKPMNHYFHTQIIFTRQLTHEEQYAFWRYALKSIDSIAVSGATQFENTLEWKIDFTDSILNEAEAKKQFADFLKKQQHIIQDFSFYQLYAHSEAS